MSDWLIHVAIIRRLQLSPWESVPLHRFSYGIAAGYFESNGEREREREMKAAMSLKT